MSAGSFIVACMRKTDAELRGARLPAAARQHEIPEEWAGFYLREELGRVDRKAGLPARKPKRRP